MIATVETKEYGRVLTLQSAFSKLVLVSRNYKRFHAIRDMVDKITELPKILAFATKAILVWQDCWISEVVYNSEPMTVAQFLKRRSKERKIGV